MKTTENKMKVEIWSDIMCPFCYIGKRKFETALSQFSHASDVEIVWKSFLLSPDMKTAPDKNIHHTHEGSIGNLCNDKIRIYKDSIEEQFNFFTVQEAIRNLVNG